MRALVNLGDEFGDSNFSDLFSCQILNWKFREMDTVRWKFREFAGAENKSSDNVQLTSSS